MKKTVWEVVEETKAGKVFLNSEQQYENLENVLAKMDKKEVVKVHEEWQDKISELRNLVLDEEKNNEFDKLHVQNGGIVSAGDDGFYMDFANWVIAQGEDVFNNFKEKGYKTIIAYIKEHNVGSSEYTFECMSYAFHPYVF